MRWLLHGDITSAVGEALKVRGDTSVAPDALGLLADASATELFKAAETAQLDLLTTDASVAAAPFSEEPARFARCIVYLQLEGGEVEQDDAITRLFSRYKRLAPGRLYTVTASRVKIRQLPRGGAAAIH